MNTNGISYCGEPHFWWETKIISNDDVMLLQLPLLAVGSAARRFLIGVTARSRVAWGCQSGCRTTMKIASQSNNEDSVLSGHVSWLTNIW